MKILLDTHTWIWYLLGDSRLSPKHKRCIEGADNDVLLSSISIWEAHLLIEKGRLVVDQSAGVWIQNALRTLPVREVPLTFAVAARSRALRMEHEDPADRFIAATAIEMKIPLLTSDEKMLACRDVQFY